MFDKFINRLIAMITGRPGTVDGLMANFARTVEKLTELAKDQEEEAIYQAEVAAEAVAAEAAATREAARAHAVAAKITALIEA